jgi:addiction module HigA family antidote
LNEKGEFNMIGKIKPLHPGEVLLEVVIRPLGLTRREAAARLGVTRRTLSLLLSGKVSLTPEMATRIARATNTSPKSWLFMQAKVDLWNVAKKPPRVRELKAAAV